MNGRERAICSRLQRFRKASEWSQSDLAYWVDGTRDQIASIESRRVPLRFQMGDELCLGLGMSQRWLAEGQGPSIGYITIGKDVKHRIPTGILFSQAYDRFLKPVIDAHYEVEFDRQNRDGQTKMQKWVLRAVGELDWNQAFNLTAAQLRGLFEGLPPDLARELYARIAKVAEEFTYEHSQQLKAIGEAQVKAGLEKKIDLPLQGFSLKSKRIPMKMTLPALLERVRKATRGHGIKSFLARRLGVQPARITEWLRKIDAKEPGGAYTLAMLDWVEEWEANQTKSPGSEYEHYQGKDPKENIQ